MAILENHKRSFCIIPAGERCITKPLESRGTDNYTTYVFAIPYDPNKLFSYLTVCLHPRGTFPEDWAATIYGHAVKGVVMGD